MNNYFYSAKGQTDGQVACGLLVGFENSRDAFHKLAVDLNYKYGVDKWTIIAFNKA